MLERDAVHCVLLELWVVESTAGEDDKLGAAMTLLEGPAIVGHVVLQKLVQGETFNVDGLHRHEMASKNKNFDRLNKVTPEIISLGSFLRFSFRRKGNIFYQC